VAVVGKVGCGKSSLLAAITGELTRYKFIKSYKIFTALQRPQAVTSFFFKNELLMFLGHSSPPLLCG